MSHCPFTTPAITATRAKYQAALTKVLRKAGASAAKQVRKKYKIASKMQKDDAPDTAATDAATLAAKIDLSDFDIIMDISGPVLEAMASEAGDRALAQVGATEKGDLINQVYDEAVTYSRERSAELIGKKWVNGRLVNNPNAAWSISEATRNEIRGILTNAFAGSIEPKEVEALIAEAGAFSPDRAALIARTEISRANNYGALSGYRSARDIGGLALQKSWLPDLEACPICIINADEGPIDLDEAFPSGDLAPPAHPNCECTITASVVDE